MSFVGVGRNTLPPTKKWDVELGDWRFFQENSWLLYRLITKLISAHSRSCSGSSDYFCCAFALVRDCSITPRKQNHRDWPTLLARWMCPQLPVELMPFWYEWGWWMNDHAELMPHQSTVALPLWIFIWAGSKASLYKNSSVAEVQCVLCLHSKPSPVRRNERNVKNVKWGFSVHYLG